MSTTELLKTLYAKIYEQKEVLSEAPALTQNPSDTNFNLETADQELRKVISYLMGVPDIRDLDFDKAIEIIQTHYSNQPEWKDFLVEYFEYETQKEEENLKKQEEALIKEIEEFTKKLSEEE